MHELITAPRQEILSLQRPYTCKTKATHIFPKLLLLSLVQTQSIITFYAAADCVSIENRLEEVIEDEALVT